MKTLISIISFLTLTFTAIAQGQKSFIYTEISKPQFDSCKKPNYLIKSGLIKKKAGKLTVPITGKATKYFKDDSTDEGFHEFEYIGNIKGTQIVLIKRTDYNSEEYYLINRLIGTIDTLIGMPVLSSDMINFACINIPGTDERQYIQTGTIKNGRVVITHKFESKKEFLLTEVKCAMSNSVLTKNSEGQFWIITFQNRTNSGT